MKFKIKPILPVLIFIAVSCSSCDIYFQKPVLEFTKKNKFQVIDPYIEILQKTVDSITKVKREKGFTHIDYALLWVANSAEYKALCYQAYNFAKLRLDQRLSSRRAKNCPVSPIPVEIIKSPSILKLLPEIMALLS